MSGLLDRHDDAGGLYTDLRSVLEAEGRWRVERDAPLLDRLVVNHLTAKAALADACRNPWVEGASKGKGLVAHPGFAVAARCDAIALSAARELRLTQRYAAVKTADDEPEAGSWAALDELAPRRRSRTA